MNNKQDIKEPFCGACAVIPLAMAGVGASAYGSNNKGSYKKNKQIMLWGGIITIIISILIAVYFLWFKECSQCLPK